MLIKIDIDQVCINLKLLYLPLELSIPEKEYDKNIAGIGH